MRRRGKYSEVRFKILQYLVTKTDQGECLRQDVIREYKLSRSSANNVIKMMKEDGAITEINYFRNNTKIRITPKGREEYETRLYPKGRFELPIFIQKYLNHKQPKITDLFPIQNQFIKRGLLYRPDNVCIFGYPGSGKTLIAELVMANMIHNGGKVLYCTPYKALDWQKYQDFKDSFKIFPDVNVMITDGDNRIPQQDLENANVIIGTYERVMGAIRAHEKWLDSVSLVCADEITLLAQDDRGGTLDLILTKLKLHNKPIRLITLSSLVGNALAISEWLNSEPVIDNRPQSQIEIKESLVYKDDDELVFFGKDGNKKSVKTELPVIEYIVKKNLEVDETTLIFVGSRNNAEGRAELLKKYHKFDQSLANRALEFFNNEIREKTELTKYLIELIGHGIAFHHAGLQRKARKFVEGLIKESVLRTVVATTTLSHGVDYRIDNVIIDLPEIVNAHNHELQGYEYINLKGRTGRHGKSRNANVYVLTDKQNADTVFNKYFLSSPEPIFPETTFDKENISALILYEAESGLNLEKIKAELSQTFYAKHFRTQEIKFEKIVHDMLSFGFLRKNDKQYQITPLGKKVNSAGLMPYDAARVLGLTARISVEDLLELASSIDLAKRVRKRESLKDETVMVLKMWIEGKSIDEIRSKIKSDYDDQDILELAKYTALSLRKMSVLVKSKKLIKILNLVERRKIS